MKLYHNGIAIIIVMVTLLVTMLLVPKTVNLGIGLGLLGALAIEENGVKIHVANKLKKMDPKKYDLYSITE